MASIITLTLNPALDVTTSVDVVTPTHKLRCGPATAEPGGGGVNVARVVDRLGEPTLAVVPLGGATGSRLGECLAAESVDYVAVPTSGETRESFTVNELSTGNQFRFVIPGHPLDHEALAACREQVLASAQNASCLVISGSMPEEFPDGFLDELITAVEQLDTSVLIDTSGPALLEAINSAARLVKPSARELSAVVGRDLITEADIHRGLLEMGSEARCGAIVVSIGAGGAMLLDRDDGFHRFRAPTVRVNSAVGAGDSMVAGIAVALARGQSMADAVQLGIATGTAAVLTAGSELCHPADVDALYPLVYRST